MVNYYFFYRVKFVFSCWLHFAIIYYVQCTSFVLVYLKGLSKSAECTRPNAYLKLHITAQRPGLSCTAWNCLNNAAGPLSNPKCWKCLHCLRFRLPCFYKLGINYFHLNLDVCVWDCVFKPVQLVSGLGVELQ